ncbi:MAG: hypothetical protein ABIT08_08725 [Bacteroidia bacterium]
MKKLKLISTSIIIATGMTFIACNSSTDKSAATNTDNASDKMTTTTNEQAEKAEAYPVGESGKGPNGGTIEEAEPNHIEMVADGKDLVFYLLDGETNPMDMKGVKGNVEMQYADKSTKKIELMEMSTKQTAMEANSGQAFTAVCTLTKDSKSYSATFSSEKDLPKHK